MTAAIVLCANVFEHACGAVTMVTIQAGANILYRNTTQVSNYDHNYIIIDDKDEIKKAHIYLQNVIVQNQLTYLQHHFFS